MEEIQLDSVTVALIVDNTAFLLDHRREPYRYIGRVWIDHTGAWNVQYAPGETYLPINEMLPHLGYEV